MANSAPDIHSSPPPLDASGAFHYQLDVSDHDLDQDLLLALEKAPEGMRLDQSSASIHWKPSFRQAGRHSVVLSASDRHGGVTRQSFGLLVMLKDRAVGVTGPAARR